MINEVIPSEPFVLYLDDSMQPVNKNDATFARVTYPDGRSVLGVVKSNQPTIKELDISEKAEGYKPLRKRYNIELFGAMNGYLTMKDDLRSARNEASQLIVEYFYQAFIRGYTESGGDENDLAGDSDDLAWINARTDEELGYIKTLFVTLKEAKADPESTRDTLIVLAHERADGYTDTLDAVYAEGKLRGAKNIMLTMVGDDGNESCADCVSRKGKRYSAKKWLAIGYPPSRDFICHGYNCAHYLVTDDGKRFTP